MSGFVYAIECGEAVKIGWAKDPNRRSHNLRIGNPIPMRLCGYVSATKDQEKQLHSLFSKYRIRGEWFRKEGPVIAFLGMLVLPPRSSLARLIHPLIESLSKYMVDHGLNDRSMAALIGGCQESAVRKWRLGERVPRREFQKRLLEITDGKVTPLDFILQSEDAA